MLDIFESQENQSKFLPLLSIHLICQTVKTREADFPGILSGILRIDRLESTHLTSSMKLYNIIVTLLCTKTYGDGDSFKSKISVKRSTSGNFTC